MLTTQVVSETVSHLGRLTHRTAEENRLLSFARFAQQLARKLSLLSSAHERLELTHRNLCARYSNLLTDAEQLRATIERAKVAEVFPDGY